MLLNNYTGQLLIAQPKCKSNFFSKGVILIVRHDARGGWGVMINKRINSDKTCLADVMNHISIENLSGIDAPLYIGGPLEKGKICIIHSSDWSSSSTHVINKDISITTDISVLVALSGGYGPEKFRAVCGFSSWGPGQLEGEQSGEEPWEPYHSWLDIPATLENVFDINYEDQWLHTVSQAVNHEVNEWF